MSSEPDQNQPSESFDYAREVKDTKVEDEMEQSYIDYAMSVIAGRALPDVRDGLKPVHRRILYAMHEMGVSSGGTHRKSSSVIGETMGDYHPHGDSAIYDTLVRMAQPFSMRYPLIDGQGNFGSVDGDPAAAMRYTESRMAPIAEELLNDIEKDTVDFKANYDDRVQEPEVLPSAFPNLLVNGSSGIAVGMSTDIPPHNLGEVIDATVEIIDNPGVGLKDLMEHIPGPDFPTGAKIVGRSGILNAYKTGRGRIRMRADVELEEVDGRGNDKIIVNEIPFQQNKEKLIKRVADDVKEEKIEGLSAIRDESDRDGIRIVFEVKNSAHTEVVKNQLISNHLEKTFGMINLALVDGQPRVLTLKETLEHYIEHRKEVVRRRTEYDLKEAEDRSHILTGRLTALDNADDVVELIQDAEDRDGAREALQDAYDFSDEQAAHIVRMQLGSLTSMEAAEIEEEYDDIQETIERLETILGDEDELMDVIKEELQEIKDDYADERRTQIVEDVGQVTDEDLIPEEDVAVVLSEEDYIKRMPLDGFEAQNRGGKGVIGTDLKDGDSVSKVFTANTHDYLLCFTSHGKVHELKAYRLPEFGRTARGKSAVNVLDLETDEELTAVVNTSDLEDDQYLSMVTKQGYVKRTQATEFENIYSSGIIAAKLEGEDQLVDVEVTEGHQDLILGTRDGMTIRFDENDVRAMGRTARGVQGMSLTGDDEVIGMVAANGTEGMSLLTVTENGFGKRTDLDDYRQQSRNGKGLIDIKTDDRNGKSRAIKAVEDDDDLMIMSAEGQIMRIRAGDISQVGRNTKGVRVMRLSEGDTVASVDVV